MKEDIFKVSKEFKLQTHTDDITTKLCSIVENDVKATFFEAKVPTFTTYTYTLRSNGNYVSIWHNPDAISFDRKGLKVTVIGDKEEAIYSIILEVLHLPL